MAPPVRTIRPSQTCASPSSDKTFTGTGGAAPRLGKVDKGQVGVAQRQPYFDNIR